MKSALYFGRVMHSRLRPKTHRFTHRVFSVLLDVDEIPSLASRLRLFSLNRFNLFSFHDRDHGDADGQPLRNWAEARLAEHGITLDGGRIQLLCFPRVFGYVFNPLSVWYCRADDGTLKALIYEVHNTFGERHAYVCPVDPACGRDGIIGQAAEKAFYVSPFIDMAAEYRFRVRTPGERMSILIREYGPAGEILRATLSGTRRNLTDRVLLGAFFTHPLMTLKVSMAIYWHAFRLWRKKIPAIPHRPKQAYSDAEARRRPGTTLPSA